MNRLYYGNCLTIMRDMPPASVDLICLDPPFNSNRDDNAICKDETGRPLPPATKGTFANVNLNLTTNNSVGLLIRPVRDDFPQAMKIERGTVTVDPA